MYIIKYENHFQFKKGVAMRKRESYHTKQKEKILSMIKKQKKEFTVKQLYNSLNNEIGLTTIYRLIDKLVYNGRLNKYIAEDNNTYYQYLEECHEENHFYLKCDNCGNLIHIDCDCIKELSQHIIEKHQFCPTKDKFIINGICNKCNRKG